MWTSHAVVVFLALIRCHSCSDFQPVRRYHPATKFNSNSQDDLVTAEDFQYAYGGGESEGVVNYSHDHEVDLTENHAEVAGESTSIGVSSGFHQETPGFGEVHQESVGDHHTGEVELTGSGSELGYHLERPPDHYHGYTYGPPDHNYGYQYIPPPPALPAITIPPPQAQEPKQSPGFTYYYLGRHLWYIPLYFSIYFILYVGALVLKSVARHKILFPEQLKVAAQQGRALRQLERATRRYNM